MSLFELTDEGLAPIAQTTFTALGLMERSDIQAAVRKHISAITPGVKTMVVAEEFGDWIDVNRRIDLLCIDEDARLVIVELKRDNSSHMELQALRYAAMVSTMRFDQAVEAHRKYLRQTGSTADAEQTLREFLDIEDGPVALSETVRIVLASSDFSTELTTTALWLNKSGLDVRCVRMGPHKVDGRIFIDVQQVIPLPAAEKYQVALREKTTEQAAVRSQQRDMTRYDLTIDDTVFTSLPKRRLIYEMVAEAIRQGLTPVAISAAVPWRESTMFASSAGNLNEVELLKTFNGKYLDRYYTNEKDLFRLDGKTYALSNQWGNRTLEAVENIKKKLPHNTLMDYESTTPVMQQVSHNAYVLRRRENGTIEVEHDSIPCQPAKRALREIALELGLSLENGRGSEMNTRQLGLQVMKAIEAL